MKFKFHPVTELFPLMSDDEFSELKTDISQKGQREPVWTYQGQVIDGRNRIKACTELGIEPKTQEWDGRGSLVGFVVSLNLHRRHLSSGQKAMVATEVESMLAEEAKKRQAQQARINQPQSKKNPQNQQRIADSEKGQARDQAAKLTGTNRQYVSDAKKIKQEAPELAAKVHAGTMTLPQAKNEVKRREKRAALHAKASAVSTNGNTEPPRLIHGDCLEYLNRAKVGTPRLIFADPPYNIGVDYGDGVKADSLPDKEFVDWCRQWASLCHGILADDGSMWVLIGDEYADYLGLALRKVGFHRRAWIKWYETFGVNCSNNFNRTSRHLFYCVKNPKHFVFHPDAVSRPSDRQTKYNDKRAAEGGKIWDDVWQVSRLTGTCDERIPDFPTQLPLDLLRPIVGCSSDPGDLVLDPFCGSATTGVASLELGRRFTGIERQKKFHQLATLRLKGVTCATGQGA